MALTKRRAHSKLAPDLVGLVDLFDPGGEIVSVQEARHACIVVAQTFVCDIQIRPLPLVPPLIHASTDSALASHSPSEPRRPPAS